MRTDYRNNLRTPEYRVGIAGAFVAAIAASSVLAAGGGIGMQTMNAYADDGNGLVIPMYGWGAGHEKVIDAKQDNPGTEMIVVINPSNGAGGSEESHWSDVVDDLQDEDVKVVGYVSTAYAGRSQDNVEQEIDNYNDWYGVDGIFFDEVRPSAYSYYEELYEHTKGEDGIVILNPGASVPESYEEVADIVIVYENYGVPSGVDSNGISEGMLAALPYGLDPSESEFDQLSDEVGYLYVSPDWLVVASSIGEQADWAD